MNNQLLIGLGILGFALLLDIIGTAIPYWWVASEGRYSSNTGLFQACNSMGELSECLSVSSAPDWWKATQAMMILSILVLAGAVGLAILFGFIMKDNKQLGLLSGVLGAAGAGLAILGVIIYGAKATDLFPVGGLHAGFGLAILSAILAVVGAIMMVMSRNTIN